FGHATRVNQIITELLKSPKLSSTTSGSSPSISTSSSSTTELQVSSSSSSRHTIYIVSDAPQFIFQDVIALGAIYRNAKVDAGVVQPLAYSVDREKTIEGCKQFLSRRDEMIQLEVSWLAQAGIDCVLADAPFLPCAAASAYGIPAILITNFTFDEVYRFLQEGDALDKDVIACADAALEDYKKASLLLRLPGSIDIPSFGAEILTMELEKSASTPIITTSNSSASPSAMSGLDEAEEEETSYEDAQIEGHFIQKKKRHFSEEQEDAEEFSLGTSMEEATPSGIMSPANSVRTTVSSPNMSLVNSRSNSSFHFTSSFSSSSSSLPSTSTSSSKLNLLTRKAIDVPLVVRMAVNTREYVLRSLGMDELTIQTKKVALVSFGGQQLKEGWGNPLPEGWIGVICGLPADYELPKGFYRSPHGVYVPDLTRAADIVIGKLGYGTCSECIAHDKPLIYVSRPQFVEEHGLIKMMRKHGLPVEMTADEFEDGHWQRAILEADRQKQEEIEECRRYEKEGCNIISSSSSKRSRCRSTSVSSLSTFGPKGPKMVRLSPPVEEEGEETEERTSLTLNILDDRSENSDRHKHSDNNGNNNNSNNNGGNDSNNYNNQIINRKKWIPNNGGEVCAQLIEKFMEQLQEAYHNQVDDGDD
ncbi:hypothetical protein BX616_004236, partial [Lobosporangium transversale]